MKLVLYRNYDTPEDWWHIYREPNYDLAVLYAEMITDMPLWDQVMLVEIRGKAVTVVESWDRKEAEDE